jgi:hypothetical protein
MRRNYRFLSWGLGKQSTYLLVLAGLGLIERIDVALVADTLWEREHSYSALKFYTEWASQHDIPVEIVSAGNIRELGATEHIHLPFWTDSGAPLRRQCTKNFKLNPLKKGMRKFAGLHPSKPPHPRPGQFEVLIGFSWDEFDRMSDSRVKYMVNRYPLIEQHINRWDCEAGFVKLGLPVPEKSACIGCPYRDAREWLAMQENNPDEFEDACLFDEANRNNPLADRGSTADKLYVWHGSIPLRSVDFRAEAEKQRKGKQTPLFVCTNGMCWI